MNRNFLAKVAERWAEGGRECLNFDPRYQFGGENPKYGMDCSGLVSYVLGRAGAPLVKRLSVAEYYSKVFTRDSAPAELGRFATLFMAYFYRASALAPWSHVAIPMTPNLVMDMSTTPVAGGIPEAISGEHEISMTPYRWSSYPNDAQDNRFGREKSERLYQLIELWADLRALATANADGDPDLSAADFGGPQWTASFETATASQIAGMFQCTCSFRALKYLVAAITGVHVTIVEATMSRVDPAAVVLDNSPLHSVFGMPLSQFVTQLLTHFVTDNGFRVYPFGTLWDMVEDLMNRPTHPGPMVSGINLRDRDRFDRVGSVYVPRYLDPQLLQSFLVYDEANELAAADDNLYRVPVRL